MPLADDLRDELAAVVAAKECDRLAEISALFHGAGRAHLHGRSEISLHVDVASSAVARRLFSLLRSFGLTSELRTYRRRAFDRATRYQLHVAGDAPSLDLLRRAGVLSTGGAPLARPPKRIIARSCCRRAYLRGALLAAGSLSGPRARHLEIRAASREGAEFLAATAAAEGVPLTVQERATHAAAYAKGSDPIAALLAVVGASDTVLALEERSVVASTRARANRLANADHANLVRASRAARAQLEAVRRLERRGRLASLPLPLREIAQLRLRYPSLSVAELARKCHPPVTKAAAHRRLRRLQQLAGA